MSYTPKNPNGSATSANSSPVVIASDQATVPVSLASVPSHAVTNAGTFVVQENGAALTSLQLIDDTVATLGTTTYTEATTKGNIIGAVRRDADTTLVDTTNEIAPLQVDARGFLKTEVFSGETLPISLAINTPTLQSGSTTEVTQATGTNLHTVVDSGTITTVSTVTNLSQLGGATVPIGAGLEATAIRVTLPTNGTGIVGLAAGTNGIGKLTANSGIDIGDVDVTSIIPGTGTTNLGKAEDSSHTTGDTGVFILGVRNDNASTTYGADQDYAPITVDLKGSTIIVQKAATGTQTSVASSATNVTLLAANSARRGVSIYNDSTAILYLRCAATATTSNFTTKLFEDDYWEAPAGYTGIIDGIWASATGNARITEFT